MPDYTLKAEPVLGGLESDFGKVTLEVISDLSIVSIAVPQGGEKAMSTVLKNSFGVDLPQNGSSTTSPDGANRFFGMTPDQIFALSNDDAPDAVEAIQTKLGDAGYYTLQTDNWVLLRLSGEYARKALERICPIDLHPASFPEGKVVRTVMEHLGATIVYEGESSFLLMSPSSSAKSFLHAVETSIKNVS